MVSRAIVGTEQQIAERTGQEVIAPIVYCIKTPKLRQTDESAVSMPLREKKGKIKKKPKKKF
jgi:hypothetical protein